MFRIVAMATLCSVVPAGSNAAELTFSSGTAQTALIELFTSEGCSSCPPAEQWLAERRADAGLWREFVPVAWHVTYWDQLGWADRFGQRAFTDRQYAYAAAWHSDSVYTPCFVRDGVEWRPGRAAGDGHPAGVLQARYDPQTGGLQVEFRPAAPSPDHAFDVHAVQLGGGLRSQVESGRKRRPDPGTRVRGAGRHTRRAHRPGRKPSRNAGFSSCSRPWRFSPRVGGMGDAPRGSHSPAGDGRVASILADAGFEVVAPRSGTRSWCRPGSAASGVSAGRRRPPSRRAARPPRSAAGRRRLRRSRAWRDEFADDIEAVRAAVEREARLLPEFGRQRLHEGGRLVGRVADDEVVACRRHGGEDVAAVQRHAAGQPVLRAR